MSKNDQLHLHHRPRPPLEPKSARAETTGTKGRLRRRGLPRPRPTSRSIRTWSVLPVALVVVVVAVLVGTYLSSTRRSSSSKVSINSRARASGTAPAPAVAPAAVMDDISSVHQATLAQIGSPKSLAGPIAVAGNPPELSGSDGKPEILYVGAEFCPFCAAERWALVEALLRFGAFENLGTTHSSSTDEYPDTQTFSFFDSRYSSPDLDFASVELETNEQVGGAYPTLERLTRQETAVVDTYDRAPYTSQAGAIPFVDIANRFVSVGASFDPAVLSGLSLRQIAGSLSDPRSPVAVAIDGTANLIASAISAATGEQPNR
jgi:hypothetical protein